MSWFCVAIERSSAYERTVVLSEGVGRSCRNKLKRIGERTAPWGTPFGRVRVRERCERRMTWAERREMNAVNQRVSLFWGRSRDRIFCVRICLGTVSNALLISMVASVVHFGGSSLKPSAISCVSLVKYVCVLRLGRNPCWWFAWGVCCEIRVSMRRSMTLDVQQRSEIGLSEAGTLEGLWGFRRGMMWAWRQMFGMVLHFHEVLYI